MRVKTRIGNILLPEGDNTPFNHVEVLEPYDKKDKKVYPLLMVMKYTGATGKKNFNSEKERDTFIREL